MQLPGFFCAHALCSGLEKKGVILVNFNLYMRKEEAIAIYLHSPRRPFASDNAGLMESIELRKRVRHLIVVHLPV
jgi:hypothetical protein